MVDLASVLPVVLLQAHLLANIAFNRNSIMFILDFDRPARSKIAHIKGCCILNVRFLNITNLMLVIPAQALTQVVSMSVIFLTTYRGGKLPELTSRCARRRKAQRW